MNATTPNRLTPDERYQRDPVFHALVSTLRASLREGNFTPTELREAAMLAASIHEHETIRPLMIGRATPERVPSVSYPDLRSLARFGFACPDCKASDSWAFVNGSYQCQACGSYGKGKP